jgi:alkyl sulfatase BDS1-like metallo-beta-lactamase superfamily hydrolase
MGYMAEAATWRNSYLTAAAELRKARRRRAWTARS